MTDTEFQDPGDTPFYLLQNDWRRLRLKDTDHTFFAKTIEEGGAELDTLIQLTPGGRRKFFVEDPPEGFREAAHGGRCLTDRGVPDGEDVYRIHFRTRPESLADGIRLLREMLDPDQ